jgi:hypothetical protein
MAKIIKRLVILCFLIFIAKSSIGQDHPFMLKGSINADTGKINLYLIADISFYPKGFTQTTAKLNNGKFEFVGSIPYPVGVRLLTPDKKYFSGFFMIAPGNQSVSVSLDSNRVVPSIQNEAMDEYFGQFHKAF